MTYDVISYNGESDMLELRLNMLSPYVDQFIICEAKTTFSGHKKPLYFGKQESKFSQWWPKITYHIIDENYSEEEIAQAEQSPNTQGASHWKREFLQKEAIHKALIKNKVQDHDRVYIGDVDEIWEPYDGPLAKLKLRVYAYYLNNESDEQFWGTLTGKYAEIKGECLNHLRSRTDIRTPYYWGWHFTSMGGLKEVQRKLNDSYTTQSYNTYDVQRQLSARHYAGIDYLGRDFTFKLSETNWPDYLKNHRKTYQHLSKKYA